MEFRNPCTTGQKIIVKQIQTPKAAFQFVGPVTIPKMERMRPPKGAPQTNNEAMNIATSNDITALTNDFIRCNNG